jgi:hypothetical protein
MITRLGELSLTDVVPILATLREALAVAQGIGITNLSAQLSGLGQVLAAITVAPPNLGATIQAAAATVASLQASIGGPTVTLQVGAITSLLASLNFQLGQLIAIQIPDPNVSAYVYEGPSAALGGELQAAIDTSLPGVPATTYAIILATTSAPAWVLLGGAFKLST